jgi:hypothetical protein
VVAAFVGAIVIAIVAGSSDEISVAASYDELASGGVVPGEYAVFFSNGVAVDLAAATDPADPFAGFIVPDEGERLLMFELQVVNGSNHDLSVYPYDFGLVDSSGGHNSPIAVVIDNHRAPREIAEGEFATIQAVFEIGAPGSPRELSFSAGAARPTGFGDQGGRTGLRTIVYKFR